MAPRPGPATPGPRRSTRKATRTTTNAGCFGPCQVRVGHGISPSLPEHVMAKKGKSGRELIRLVSTADTGYFYTTSKNRKRTPDKLVLKKYDPVIRKHVEFKESKI